VTDQEPSKDDRTSNFRLEISIAVGYQRKRAGVSGRFEGPLVTGALLVAGIVLVFLIFWRLSTLNLL
jgi:hypothetical protein